MNNVLNAINAPKAFLKDSSGSNSSKRYWGNNLLMIGVILAILLFIASVLAPIIYKPISNDIHNNWLYIVTLFFYSGGGLLFGGVFENIRKK